MSPRRVLSRNVPGTASRSSAIKAPTWGVRMHQGAAVSRTAKTGRTRGLGWIWTITLGDCRRAGLSESRYRATPVANGLPSRAKRNGDLLNEVNEGRVLQRYRLND